MTVTGILRPWSGLFIVLMAAGMIGAKPATAAPGATVAERAQPDRMVVPHKALYKIEMVQKRSGAQVVNVSGDMFFEWKASCDAWTTDHRFNLKYEYADSAPMRITSDFTTYERYAGDAFNFNSRRYRDGELYQELRGRGAIPASAKSGEAVFTLPEDLKFDLSEGTLFPAAHTLAVLKAARSGQKFYSATIFDGSDEEGPAEVSAFIGPEVKSAGPAGKGIDKTLLKGKAWKVRLAFFPLSSDEIGSDYEMDAILHDNGIISDMHVDYKDFSVAQTLIALEKAQAPACGGKQITRSP